MRHPYNLQENLDLDERLNLIESFQQRLFIALILIVLSGYFTASELTKNEFSRVRTTRTIRGARTRKFYSLK